MNFARACLITLSNRWYKNFLPKRSHSPEKRQDWILLFYQSGRRSNYIENMSTLVEAAWHTVLNCCTMYGTGQPREHPQIGDRGSNPGSGSQSVFIFIGSTCSRSLVSFVNIYYFTWLTSFDFTLI